MEGAGIEIVDWSSGASIGVGDRVLEGDHLIAFPPQPPKLSSPRMVNPRLMQRRRSSTTSQKKEEDGPSSLSLSLSQNQTEDASQTPSRRKEAKSIGESIRGRFRQPPPPPSQDAISGPKKMQRTPRPQRKTSAKRELEFVEQDGTPKDGGHNEIVHTHHPHRPPPHRRRHHQYYYPPSHQHERVTYHPTRPVGPLTRRVSRLIPPVSMPPIQTSVAKNATRMIHKVDDDGRVDEEPTGYDNYDEYDDYDDYDDEHGKMGEKELSPKTDGDNDRLDRWREKEAERAKRRKFGVPDLDTHIPRPPLLLHSMSFREVKSPRHDPRMSLQGTDPNSFAPRPPLTSRTMVTQRTSSFRRHHLPSMQTRQDGTPLLTIQSDEASPGRTTTEMDSEADFVKSLVKRQLNLELKYKKDAVLFDFRPDPSMRKSMLAPIAEG